MAKVKNLTQQQQDKLDERIFNSLVKRFSNALIKPEDENIHKKPVKPRTRRSNADN